MQNDKTQKLPAKLGMRALDWLTSAITIHRDSLSGQQLLSRSLNRGGLVLVLGGPGVGKSSSVMLPLIRLAVDRHVAVMDGKRDLVRRVRRDGFAVSDLLPDDGEIHQRIGSIGDHVSAYFETSPLGLLVIDDLDGPLSRRRPSSVISEIKQLASLAATRGGTVVIGACGFWPTEVLHEAIGLAETLWIGRRLAGTVSEAIATELLMPVDQLRDRLAGAPVIRAANAMLFAGRSVGGWQLQTVQMRMSA